MTHFDDDFANTISLLAYKGIDTAAIAEALTQLNVDANPMAKKKALQSIGQVDWATIAETPEVIYDWLVTVFLVTASAGVAIGRRGSEESITRYDVRMAVSTSCDEWPDCISMRAAAFAEAFMSIVVGVGITTE